MPRRAPGTTLGGCSRRTKGAAMSDKKLVLSIFESEAAADQAVKFMTNADLAKNDAIGILVLDEHGEVKTHKVGSHSFFKGAGVGLVLGLLGPIGIGVAATTGGLLGLLHHKGLGLDDSDRERIGAELANGRAAGGGLVGDSGGGVGGGGPPTQPWGGSGGRP